MSDLELIKKEHKFITVLTITGIALFIALGIAALALKEKTTGIVLIIAGLAYPWLFLDKRVYELGKAAKNDSEDGGTITVKGKIFNLMLMKTDRKFDYIAKKTHEKKNRYIVFYDDGEGAKSCYGIFDKEATDELEKNADKEYEIEMYENSTLIKSLTLVNK